MHCMYRHVLSVAGLVGCKNAYEWYQENSLLI